MVRFGHPWHRRDTPGSARPTASLSAAWANPVRCAPTGSARADPRSLATWCHTVPPGASLSSPRCRGASLGPNHPRSALMEGGPARVTLTRGGLLGMPRLNYGQAVAPLCCPFWARFELNSAQKRAWMLATLRIVDYRELAKKKIHFFAWVSFLEVQGYH